MSTATGTLATLPECTLAELDVLRYVDVIFADEATRAGLTADIVRLVSGPTPQSQVLTSFEPGIETVLIGCPRIAEGQSTGPVYAAYTGVWNTTGGEYNVGLQVQATIRASVQSSIVAQAMAQKALAHATCPKEYRTPTENAIIDGPARRLRRWRDVCDILHARPRQADYGAMHCSLAGI